MGSWRRATEFLQHLATPSTRTDVVTLSSVASWHDKKNAKFQVPKMEVWILTPAPLTKYYCLLLLLCSGGRSNIHYGNFEGIPAQCLLQIALTFFWALRDNDGQQLFSTSVLQMIFGRGFFGGDCGGIGVAKQKSIENRLYYRLLQERFFSSKFHERLFKSGIWLILYILGVGFKYLYFHP